MIKSFKHKGLEFFFETGNTKGIQANHKQKLRIILGALDVAIAAAQARDGKARAELHGLDRGNGEHERGDPALQPAEERVEAVLLVDIVVAAKHAGHERLAEATGAHEEEERPGLLQEGDVVRLVDVVVAFGADSLEVRHAVWDFEIVFHVDAPLSPPI